MSISDAKLDPPLVKKRTRIKVQVQQPVEKLIIEPEVDLEEVGLEDDQLQVSEKTRDSGREGELTVEESAKDEIKQPLPAPRKSRSPIKEDNVSNEVEDKPLSTEDCQLKEEIIEGASQPELGPSTASGPPSASIPQGSPSKTNNDKVMSRAEKPKSKKLKVADVLPNILRRDKGKSDTTVPAKDEGESREKGEGDTYSPWDSPPPPQALEKVYIQHRNGFSVRDWSDFHSKPVSSQPNDENTSAVDIALSFHRVWSRLSLFSHGIVAGMAVCHALSVAAALAATHSNVADFVQFYHFLSLKIHFAVYIFTTLCIISCLDKLGIGSLSKKGIEATSHAHGTLLTTFGYLLAMVFTLAAHRHTAAIEAYSNDTSLWDAHGLQEWSCLVTTRDVLLLLCWIFMSCSKPADLTQETLLSLRDSRSEELSSKE